MAKQENTNHYGVLKYPLATEKSVRMMQNENKLHFVIDKSANKADVKEAVETLFKVKVIGVQTLNSIKGTKHAYVRLAADNLAIDIATDLGLM